MTPDTPTGAGGGPGPDERHRQNLIEQAAGAWRPHDRDGRIEPHPAWADLDDAGREEAFRTTLAQRRLEAAMDSRGLSATGRVVMARVLHRR